MYLPSRIRSFLWSLVSPPPVAPTPPPPRYWGPYTSIKPRIYLAGPITGLSYGEARNGWRAEFASLVDANLIDLFSPMRQEGHLAEIQHIEHKAYDGILSQAKAIVAKDRLDVQRADLVVACFLGAKAISLGTAIELGWADAMGKTTLIVMEPEGNPHDRFFLTEMADFRVQTVREAAEVASAILLPGV